MKKTETHEEQVMRVLEEMVREGEMLKIKVNGKSMYGLPEQPEPMVRVKCKPMSGANKVNKNAIESTIKRHKYVARSQKGAITRKLNTLLRKLGAK